MRRRLIPFQLAPAALRYLGPAPVTARSCVVRFMLCVRHRSPGIGIAQVATVVRLAVMVGMGLVVTSLVGCGGKPSQQPDGGQVMGTGGTNTACSDLFDPDVVRTYSLEIDPAEWQSIEAEFANISGLMTSGNDFAVYHPAVFRLDQETVASASVRLHGQSSWLQAVMFDGARAKMQFDGRVRQDRPGRQVSRRRQADLRHAAFGLDVPARADRARMAARRRGS